jgi:hypothetical protein
LPALTTTLSGLSFGCLDVAEQVLEVALAGIERAHAPPAAAALGGNCPVSIMRCMSFSPVSALIGRLLAHELHAVVVGRIVAGGDHDAAVELLRKGGEIDALGAAQADVGDLDPRVGQPADQRGLQLRAGSGGCRGPRPPSSASPGRIGLPDLVGQRVIDLVRNAAANIVGLEAAQLGHAFLWQF